jgi:hypothetical protein
MAASVEVSGDKVAELRLIDQESFYPTLEAAGDKLLVVDFYTAWCGPCKMIYPQLCQMAEELAPQNVEFVKFECNKNNKELGMKVWRCGLCRWERVWGGWGYGVHASITPRATLGWLPSLGYPAGAAI